MDTKIHQINVIMTVLNVIVPAVYAWTYSEQYTETGHSSKGLFYLFATLNLIL
jgi:hypothetical protein